MDEEANSWIRRTKFSHTVCHRIEPSRLASFPLIIEASRSSGLKSRPTSAVSNQKLDFTGSHVHRNLVTNRQRSLSPLPETILSDVFKEARSDQKRFSTPLPQRKENGKGKRGKFFQRESRESKSRNSRESNSALKQLASVKFNDKEKSRKESAWTRYFDHSGGRVMSVEGTDEWVVDMSKLFLGLRFAHGAHSRLYHGIYKDKPVAVKIIRVPDDDENGVLAMKLEKQFTREVTLLSHLHHQNVIKFVAACKKPPVYCIITEYLSEGSLRSYLHKREEKPIPLQKLIAMSLDVARGMQYVHSQSVIHRDLKPENILIDQDFHLKVADFGIACDEAHCDTLADDPGTYRWMAPEMIKRKSYGRKVDVYSFGLILWEMVAGTIPYEDMTPIQAAFAVVNKIEDFIQNLRPAISKDCPPALQALIEQCWSLQPDKRPEFWQIVRVLEQFEVSLARDGTLNLAQHSACQDHKKGLRHWIQKLGPLQHNSSSMPKPRFV